MSSSSDATINVHIILLTDTIRHDTPRSTPGQASPSISRSFYIGGEDAEDERVDDAVDFPLEDYRQMNDDVGGIPRSLQAQGQFKINLNHLNKPY